MAQYCWWHRIHTHRGRLLYVQQHSTAELRALSTLYHALIAEFILAHMTYHAVLPRQPPLHICKTPCPPRLAIDVRDTAAAAAMTRLVLHTQYCRIVTARAIGRIVPGRSSDSFEILPQCLGTNCLTRHLVFTETGPVKQWAVQLASGLLQTSQATPIKILVATRY